MACRAATPKDSPAIGAAHVGAWQAAYRDHMPDSFLDSLTVADSERRWRASLKSPTHKTWVVETDGEIAGFCHFGASRDEDANTETGEVRAINLHPDHWRRGLGTELLGATLSELRRDGFRVATLWVLEANGRARRFYESLGWTADGGSKDEAPVGCPPLAHLRYRISLESGAPSSDRGRPPA